MVLRRFPEGKKGTVKKGAPKKVSRKKEGSKKKKANPLKMHSQLGRQELARLKNIQANQFGAEGDQAYLTKLAKKVGRGKRPSGSQDWKIRAGKATRDPQALRAGKTVQAELNPQISASRNYEAGLRKLYGNLAGEQSRAASGIQAQNAATRGTLETRFNDLASQISSEFNKSRESSSSELNRLGINMGDASQSGDIQARLATLAQSGKANALTQQDASSQGYNQLMSLLQGESANTGAGLQAASSQKRGQLESSRAGKVYSLWQQLEDQERAEKAERQQQKFLNRITRSKFGVDQDYKNAQSLNALASARKNIVASKKPRVVRKPRITR